MSTSQTEPRVLLRDIRVLRGPNLHARIPVVQATVDIQTYEHRPSTDFPECVERLLAWLPGLADHRCSPRRQGGFIERLRDGTYFAHICEHVALELQVLMGFDVSFGRARATAEEGVYEVIVAYEEEESARAAVETAIDLTLAALHGEPFDVAAAIERLTELADDLRLGPSTKTILDAARARDIPVMRLGERDSLVQLGQGVHLKRIMASQTSSTSVIAVDICHDKTLTNRVLDAAGLPVPEGQAVSSADEAWAVACDLGLPVVAKPKGGNQGKGVTVNLRTETDVRAAYEIAVDFGSEVLIERHIEGRDYRLLVINGRLIAAACREPARVIGDGSSTVRQLVDVANGDPRRRSGHCGVLTRIKLDEAVELVLAQQSLTADSVPAAGQVVQLRTNANLSTGGTATDVTDEVHIANVRLAELAAQIIGLDIAGIDIVCKDISRPLAEQGGAIVEVNAAPGLRMHVHPTHGRPRDVGTPIVEMLYPAGSPARIPIIAVSGTNGKTTTTRLIAHIERAAGRCVGMTTTEGIFINGECIAKGDCAGARSARRVLQHPKVEIAALETARGGILREGLGFDSCDIAVITNVSADHLGQRGIHTVEDLARVKQVIVDAARRDGAVILNAQDPLAVGMAGEAVAPVVYFSLRAGHPLVAAHCASGGRAVVVDGGTIVLLDGNRREPVTELAFVPCTFNGRVAFQIENVLAATAAAWSAGLGVSTIARALATFVPESQALGRFNVMDVQGVQVVIDYGHNVAAMQALGESLTALGARRTLLLISLPGDRREVDLIATIHATLRFTDEYIMFDQHERRGREALQLPRLLQEQVAGERPSQCAADQREALERAWQRARPGDRIVLIADEVEEALELVKMLPPLRSAQEDLVSEAVMSHRAATWQRPPGVV